MVSRVLILWLGLLAMVGATDIATAGGLLTPISAPGTGYANDNAHAWPMLVFRPTTYSGTGTPYPLVVCLHGDGEVGNGSSDGTLTASTTNQLLYMKGSGAMQLIGNGDTYFATHGVVVCQPQSSNSGGGAFNGNVGTNDQRVDLTIKYMLANYNIDPNRIYLTGLSAGGGATVRQAQATASSSAYKLAVIVPIANIQGIGSITDFSQFTGAITWMINDSDDTTAYLVNDCGRLQGGFGAGWIGNIARYIDQAVLGGSLPADTIKDRCLNTHPDTAAIAASGYNTNLYIPSSSLTGTYTGYYNPNLAGGWTWVSNETYTGGSQLEMTVIQGGGHGGWQTTYGTTVANAPFWSWLLAQRLGATPTGYGAGDAFGGNKILSSLLFNGSTGSNYVTIGQPSALTSVLTYNHEFTILARAVRPTTGTTGSIICRGDNTNISFNLFTSGGSKWEGNIGGTAINTGSGSYQHPLWSTIGMVNRNNSGTFEGRMILDANASGAEVAISTTQTSAKDILVGARRNASNSDSAAWYTGNIGCIAIWNYAMTDAQLHEAMGLLCPNEVLYTTFDSTNFATGLVAYYPCNDPLGTSTLHDWSPNALHGTCTATTLFDTAQHPHYPFITWGDSLCNAAGSQTSTGWQNQTIGGGSGARMERTAYALGYSGQNVAYIAGQMPPGATSKVQFETWTYVYYVGAHDFGATSNVTSFLTTAIGNMIHNRYIVLGSVPYGTGTGSGPSSGTALQDWGTTGRGQIEQMNRAEQQLVGPRFCNLQIPTVSIATLPSEANDVFQLRMPAHVVSTIGAPHPQDAGYIEWSLVVDPFLRLQDPMW